jgi:hypothetical protein
MIGPLTPAGWLIVLGILALVAGMAWLGWRGRWALGLLLTLPFIGLLVWVEATTGGPPLYADPYGPLLATIILGPIGIGWIAFLLFRAVSCVRRHPQLSPREPE